MHQHFTVAQLHLPVSNILCRFLVYFYPSVYILCLFRWVPLLCHSRTRKSGQPLWFLSSRSVWMWVWPAFFQLSLSIHKSQSLHWICVNVDTTLKPWQSCFACVHTQVLMFWIVDSIIMRKRPAEGQESALSVSYKRSRPSVVYMPVQEQELDLEEYVSDVGSEPSSPVR